MQEIWSIRERSVCKLGPTRVMQWEHGMSFNYLLAIDQTIFGYESCTVIIDTILSML